MLEYLSRYWWAVTLRGALAVVFGVIALIWPDITLHALVLLYGFYALVDGLLALAALVIGGNLVRDRRGWLIVEGVAGIGAGVVAFLWPGITALVLLYLIAAWAIATGVLEVVVAIWLRRELRGEWLLALSGIVSVVFGVFLIVRPGEGAIAVVWLIGVFAILFGVALVGLGLRLRRLGGALRGGTQLPNM
ncbi:MAG TPA: HdeD family acid-resistance protein [Actinomycetota bacterium]|nr:HdeD family acid-resistance protein [Actinomycetota bacterium]